MENCFLCKKEVKELKTTDPLGRVYFYDCSRCGQVEITSEATRSLSQEKYREKVHLLIGFNRERKYRELPQLKIHAMYLDDIFQSVSIPQTVIEKLDKLILYLGMQSILHSNYVKIDLELDYPISYARDVEDFKFHLQFLKEKSLIDNFAHGKFLTFDGWKKYEELQSNPPKENQAFIAMWFGYPDKIDEMKSIYENCIKRAIDDSSLQPKIKPVKIDLVEHNDPIDSRILVEIRKSRFLVADFTGHRGGVYFEAGYALALGIPVIWTCKKDHAEKMHFDTRQFSRIEWEDENDLYEKLKRRIEGTIF